MNLKIYILRIDKMPKGNKQKRKREPTEDLVMLNEDGTLHWCPSWCNCCEIALEQAKSRAKIMKK